MKCLAFLNAGKTVSLNYICSQNCNTRGPLADTNNLKLESTNFICQVVSTFFIILLWRCHIIFPFMSPTTFLTLHFVTSYRTHSEPMNYRVHKKSSFSLHGRSESNREILQSSLQIVWCWITFHHKFEKFLSFSLRNVCTIAQKYIVQIQRYKQKIEERNIRQICLIWNKIMSVHLLEKFCLPRRLKWKCVRRKSEEKL